MTRRIAKQGGSGSWKRPPPRAYETLRKLGAGDEFDEELETICGRYWMSCDARRTSPQPSEVFDHIAKTSRALKYASDCIALTPEVVKAYGSEYLLENRGIGYEQFVLALARDLRILERINAHAVDRCKTEIKAETRGEKGKGLEAWLLAALEDLVLRVTPASKIKAAEYAGALAVALGVSSVPSSPKALADRIRKYRKSVVAEEGVNNSV